MRYHLLGRHAATARLLATALLALAFTACGGSGPVTGSPAPATGSPAPATGSPGAATEPPAPSPTPPAPTTVPGGDDGTPAPPGTIETSWGTAWETLPPGFPLPPGAVPAEPGDPADEASSGAFVVDRAVDPVVEQVVAGLDRAGYSVEALGGPAEDGSIAVDAAGQDPACRVRVVVRPLGGLTLVSVLLGAACPWR